MKIDAIIKNIDREPLSGSLGQTLRLAERAGQAEIARWCRLELGGYHASNPAITDNVVVPEYRTVTGQHHDIYGRLLVLPSNLVFVNETRLRHGVAEIETIASGEGPVEVHDPNMCNIIKEHLNVEVYAFQFSRSSLAAILSDIRTELGDRLSALRDKAGPKESADTRNEVLMLQPNIYGLGIDLKALWRKVTGSG